MIKVNLKPSGKTQNLSDLAGWNLSLVNIKMLALAVMLYYVPPSFIEDYYQESMVVINSELAVLRKTRKKFSKKIKSLSTVKKQVEDLQLLEKKLAKRIDIVKEIVNRRANPFKVLKYIAENTPKDVWIKEMNLEGKKITIWGYSKSWKSIGSFLENLKAAIFFERNIKYTKPGKMKNQYLGKRVEIFKIETNIVSFE